MKTKDNSWQQTPILMQLVSVDRPSKKLQNDSHFVRLYLLTTVPVLDISLTKWYHLVGSFSTLSNGLCCIFIKTCNHCV